MYHFILFFTKVAKYIAKCKPQLVYYHHAFAASCPRRVVLLQQRRLTASLNLWLFFTIASKVKVTKDIFGEADDIELKDDARLTLPTEITTLNGIVVVKAIPGVVCNVAIPVCWRWYVHSSQNVANFLLNDFLTIILSHVRNKHHPAQKKTSLAHALSPLETVASCKNAVGTLSQSFGQ